MTVKKKPVFYTTEIGERICEAIASGDSVERACEGDDLPEPRAVFSWIARHDEFRRMYEAAQETRAEALVEEILNEAEEIDTMTTQSVAASKVRIDLKKWAAGKFKSARYGDRQTIDVNANVKLDRSEVLNQARKRRELARTTAE